MKHTLTILLATLLPVALAGPASAQTNPAVTNPGATPSAGKGEHQGKQASAANPADVVERKVGDKAVRDLVSAEAKALKPGKPKATRKMGKFRYHRRRW